MVRHPGVILLEEFLRPCQVSQTALAVQMGVPPRRINEIVQGKRAITADTARYWMSLQSDYEIERARRRGFLVNLRPGYGRWDEPDEPF
jgi:addiction module HigA family antidote